MADLRDTAVSETMDLSQECHTGLMEICQSSFIFFKAYMYVHLILHVLVTWYIYEWPCHDNWQNIC